MLKSSYQVPYLLHLELICLEDAKKKSFRSKRKIFIDQF